MIYEISGLRFNVRENTLDKYICDEVVKQDCYGKIINLVKGETWLDIGANIGCFSVLVASLGCDVVAFEPDKENFEITKKNMELNKVSFILNRVAIVGNDDKLRKFYYNEKKNKGTHSLLVKRGRSEKIVKCANINRAITNDIQAIKLDVEGAEYEIIKAIKDFKNVRKMVYEYHFNILGKEKYFELVSYLEECGFKVNYKSNVKKNWHLLVSAVR